MPTASKKRSEIKPRMGDTKEFELLIRQTTQPAYYVLKLYITGSSLRSTQAIANLRALCDEYLAGRYDLEVVDIYQQPAAAAGQQIIAAPTLVKEMPHPIRRMIGDLADRRRLLVGLDLQFANP